MIWEGRQWLTKHALFLLVHYRVLGVSLAVDREMVPRRLAPGNQEETHQRAGDPDDRDKLDGLKP